MAYYELSFLTPNLSPEKKNSLMTEIEESIKKLEGKVEEKFIEKKKFVYPVKKQNEGFLGIFLLSLNAEGIKKIRSSLKKNESVLRIMAERKKIRPKIRISSKKPVAETIKGREKPKKEKVKIEELDKKLSEILK